jgi:6-phosphogluconolactonase
MDEAGHLLPEKQLFRHAGSSVHPVRQKGPHAHSVIFSDTGKLFVPDLGIDQLKGYDCRGGMVIPDDASSVTVAPGNGPRFGEFSQDGKHFYLINELGSSITHFTYEKDRMTQRETITTLPEDFNGENICSDLHIAPNGKFLYASNRGHDSITVFGIGADGALSEVERVACGGKTPRNFAIDPDGKFLLVGNQDSDTIVVFAIQQDGRLQYIKTNEFPTPVCIRFLRPC